MTNGFDVSDLEDPSDLDGATGAETMPIHVLVSTYKRALDGDKDALALIVQWKRGRGQKVAMQLAHRYDDARRKTEEAETDLTRAFNKWAKHRAQLRRYSQQLDKLQEIEELIASKGG